MDDQNDGGDTTQVKCPCCGEMISLTCSKGGEQEPDADDKESWSDQDFRDAMSPRNDDQSA